MAIKMINVKLILITLLTLSCLTANAAFESHTKLVRVENKDVELLRKFVISYHDAIFEIDYKKGYVIADLNTIEKQKIAVQGFKVTSAEKWSKKLEQKKVAVKKITQQRIEKQLVNRSSKNTHSKKTKVAGIPGYECYQTVEETDITAQSLADNHSNIAEYIDIGDSWKKVNQQGGYDLKVLKITNKSIIKNKPKLFIHSAMHAREFAPAALTLDFATKLINEYNTNADIQWLVDHQEIHILFHMNPDGRKIAEQLIFQRKNMNANHCPNDKVGVDLNRNFAQSWNTTPNGSSGNACDEVYRGVSAESESETQAVSNYIRSLYADNRGDNANDKAPDNTSGLHLDIHSFGGLILWPYGHTNQPSPNAEAFTKLGNKLAWFNDYAPQQSIGLYATDGTSDNVSYGELGVAAITFELGTSFFQQCAAYTSKIKPDNLKALLYSAKVTQAPYQLPFGPDIFKITLNNSDKGSTITANQTVEISVIATTLQTKLKSNDSKIAAIHYSVNTPIWENPNPKMLSKSSGAIDNAIETLSATIDTTNLSLGKHIVYVQATNKLSQKGPISAQFITVANNSAPQAIAEITCEELKCNLNAEQSTDSDGQIVNVEWIINSQSAVTGNQVEHSFSAYGEHSVSLKITDNSGNTAEKYFQFELSANGIKFLPFEKETTATPAPTPTPSAPSEDNSANSSGGGVFNGVIIYLLLLASYFYRRIIKNNH